MHFAPLLLAAALAAPPASPPPADLMKKLADTTAAMAKAQDAADVTIDTLAEELDKSGKPTSTQQIVQRVTHPGGVDHEELVQYVQDGKDVTAEKKAKQAKDAPKDGKKEDFGADLGGPFAAAKQPRYRFTTSGADEQGLLRIHFEPSGAPADDDSVGDALVVTSSGALASMSWSPAKLPSMVRELSMTMTYTQDPTHGTVLGRIEGHGRAGLLFVQKRFRLTTTFRDYAFPGP